MVHAHQYGYPNVLHNLTIAPRRHARIPRVLDDISVPIPLIGERPAGFYYVEFRMRGQLGIPVSPASAGNGLEALDDAEKRDFEQWGWMRPRLWIWVRREGCLSM